MSFIYKRELLVSLGVVGSALTLSCGPVQPLEVPKQPVAENPKDGEKGLARELRLRVVLNQSVPAEARGLIQPEIPAGFPNDLSDYDLKARFGERQVSYGKLFRLVGEGPPFVVWPDAFNGSRIVQAKVHHRVLNGQNQWVGFIRNFTAQFDNEKSCWFISVASVLRQSRTTSEFQLRSEDTQSLLLELRLADHSVVEIEMRFRAVLC